MDGSTQRRQLVVDCSVTFKWKVTNEDFADEARELLKDMQAGAIECIAPDILHAEIASAFLRVVRMKRLNFDEAMEAVRELLATPVRLYPTALCGRKHLKLLIPINKACLTAFMSLWRNRKGRKCGRATSDWLMHSVLVFRLCASSETICHFGVNQLDNVKLLLR